MVAPGPSWDPGLRYGRHGVNAHHGADRVAAASDGHEGRDLAMEAQHRRRSSTMVEHDGEDLSYKRTPRHHTRALRATTRGLIERLPRSHRLRDPRRQLLRELANVFEDREEHHSWDASPTALCERSVLFFDGGSRGNPGPGGAGAVLVAMDRDATAPRVLWSACMSYQSDDMTNNQAEYLGVIAGLKEAKRRGLRPEVVGDSSLILRHLQFYRPPRSIKLRPLYSEARRLADTVQVEVWQLHLRAYNKMADAAANVAMDLRASVQVSHPSTRPHTAIIDALLLSDFQEWHTRHLLRTTRD